MTETKKALYEQKPLALKVLCIVAFVFGGVSILVSFSLLVSGTLPYAFRDIGWLKDWLGISREMGGVIYAFVSLILSIVAFLGVIQMWNLIKTGFWLFSASKVLYLLLPFLLLDVPFNYMMAIMLPYILIVGLLILLFSYNLRHME